MGKPDPAPQSSSPLPPRINSKQHQEQKHPGTAAAPPALLHLTRLSATAEMLTGTSSILKTLGPKIELDRSHSAIVYPRPQKTPAGRHASRTRRAAR